MYRNTMRAALALLVPVALTLSVGCSKSESEPRAAAPAPGPAKQEAKSVVGTWTVQSVKEINSSEKRIMDKAEDGAEQPRLAEGKFVYETVSNEQAHSPSYFGPLAMTFAPSSEEAPEQIMTVRNNMSGDSVSFTKHDRSGLESMKWSQDGETVTLEIASADKVDANDKPIQIDESNDAFAVELDSAPADIESMDYSNANQTITFTVVTSSEKGNVDEKNKKQSFVVVFVRGSEQHSFTSEAGRLSERQIALQTELRDLAAEELAAGESHQAKIDEINARRKQIEDELVSINRNYGENKQGLMARITAKELEISEQEGDIVSYETELAELQAKTEQFENAFEVASADDFDGTPKQVSDAEAALKKHKADIAARDLALNGKKTDEKDADDNFIYDLTGSHRGKLESLNKELEQLRKDLEAVEQNEAETAEAIQALQAE